MRSRSEWSEPLQRAFTYAAERKWRGWDPYDALRSPIAKFPWFGTRRAFRLAWIQMIKHSPWNPRVLLGVSQHRNAKALALFLSAASRAPREAGLQAMIAPLAEALGDDRVEGEWGVGWGYDFPWQSREVFFPARTPTVVVTSFVGESFLDAYSACGETEYLQRAEESCRFLQEALCWSWDETGACLSYSPDDHSSVYNASLLGARLLVLTGQRCGRDDLVQLARPLVTYVLARQRADGSWPYGRAGYQEWTDSFHTGFILCALDVYGRATADKHTLSALRRGASFYSEHCFGPAGEPYYYPDRRYPLDIHSASQAVLTFLQLRHLNPTFEDRARQVGRWILSHMLNGDGCFNYQMRRTRTVRIPFMRWSQAWGVRALAELACTTEEP